MFKWYSYFPLTDLSLSCVSVCLHCALCTVGRSVFVLESSNCQKENAQRLQMRQDSVTPKLESGGKKIDMDTLALAARTVGRLPRENAQKL